MEKFGRRLVDSTDFAFHRSVAFLISLCSRYDEVTKIYVPQIGPSQVMPATWKRKLQLSAIGDAWRDFEVETVLRSSND